MSVCVCAECAHVFILGYVLVLSSSGLPEQGYGLELWKINKLLRNLEFGRNLYCMDKRHLSSLALLSSLPTPPPISLPLPPPSLPSPRERLSSAHWPGLPLRGPPSMSDRGGGGPALGSVSLSRGPYSIFSSAAQISRSHSHF